MILSEPDSGLPNGKRLHSLMLTQHPFWPPSSPKDSTSSLRQKQWRPTKGAPKASIKRWRGPCHAAGCCHDGLLRVDALPVGDHCVEALHAQVRYRPKPRAPRWPSPALESMLLARPELACPCWRVGGGEGGVKYSLATPHSQHMFLHTVSLPGEMGMAGSTKAPH